LLSYNSELIYPCFLVHAARGVVEGAGTDDDFGDPVGLAGDGFGDPVGLAEEDFAIGDFSVVGFGAGGFAVVGFSAVGFSVVGFGSLNPSASTISRATWRST
jgi:hypothetical protein